MKAIVATNRNNYIGRDGKMMWRSSEDFKHFKELTTGLGNNIIIVGKTTFENDLRSKPLPGREIVVVGSGYKTLPQAIRHAYNWQDHCSFEFNQDIDIWVIGGSSIYRQLMPLIEEIHMSIIDDDQIGDATFHIPDEFRGDVYTYNFKPNSK